MTSASLRLEEDRPRVRRYLNRASRLVRGSREIAVWTVDISGDGARVALDTLAEVGFDGPGWELHVPALGTFPVVPVWQRGATFGLAFEMPGPARDRLDADLRRQRAGPAVSPTGG
jgi:hypothetical protein